MPFASAQLSVAVVGAPYPNKDGSNRQFEIKLCRPGDPLDLRPEPRNRYDEHAIAVFSERGVQIGYVASERAVYLGGLLRDGRTLSAIFQEESPYGAVARIGVDAAPVLAGPSDWSRRQAPSHIDDEPDFYPDFIPPDD